MPQLGKLLIVFGALIIVIGVILLLADRIPFLCKLPGDITFKSGRITVFVPIVTCLVISIILTIIFNLFGRER
ncbi:MAG: DUF2905 domain-containing protein [candidate division Zixibacteria bacterium]|nr:DUF2905 domain-containing protein [candidate division Zixibacteria bacterium]